MLFRSGQVAVASHPDGDAGAAGACDGLPDVRRAFGGTGRDLAIYREKLVPIFGKYCQSCHLPSGSAHIDMTTYGSWTRLRAQVMTRVVARTPTPMPPTGVPTSSGESVPGNGGGVGGRCGGVLGST